MLFIHLLQAPVSTGGPLWNRRALLYINMFPTIHSLQNIIFIGYISDMLSHLARAYWSCFEEWMILYVYPVPFKHFQICRVTVT